MPEDLHSLPRNVIAIFTGRNLLWQVLAIFISRFSITEFLIILDLLTHLIVRA